MESKDKSYTTRLKVKCSEKNAFEALSTKIENWWGDQDLPAQQTGDVFTISWGAPWYQFRVVEYVPNEKIIWECIDANQVIGDLEGVEKEWVGTQLHWRIKKSNENEIELHFRHEGLVPEFICYDFCANTWDRFIALNLKKHLENS